MKQILMIVFAAVMLFGLVPTSHAQEYQQTPFIAWSPDGSMIAIGYGTSVQILDADSLQVLNTISGFAEQTAVASWSPDGTKLAIVNSTDVTIWQVPWSSALARELVTYRYYEKGTPRKTLVGVDAVVWSPDGTKLASNRGRSIDIWQANDGKRIRQITDEWDRVSDLRWLLDNRLAVASVDAWIIMLNPDTGKVINYFYSPTTPNLSPGIWSIALSSDSSQLVMGYGDGLMYIWGDTRTTEFVTTTPSKRLQGHDDHIGSVSWSSNGMYIASVSRDGTVRIWDAETGEQVQVIELGANVQVNSVAWSPDGTKLAYGNPDGTITIIPAPMSAVMPTPAAHDDFIPPCQRMCGEATATPGQ
jgi:WD40 repeat protein